MMIDTKEDLIKSLEVGMLDEADVWGIMKMYIASQKRKAYLDNHPYAITKAKDNRWYTRFPVNGGGSKLKSFKSRDALEEYVVAFYQALDESPTIEVIFDRVLTERFDEGSITAATVTRNKTDFKRYFSKFGSFKIRDVTPEIIEGFIRGQKRLHNLNAKGYSNLLGLVRMIFNYARKKRLIVFRVNDVIEDIDWGKNAFRQVEKDDKDDVFSDDEVERLASYFKAHPTGKHLGLLLCFATGLRIGEMAALMWQDVSDEEILVRRTETTWTDADHHVHVEVVNLPKTRAGKRIVPIPKSGQWVVKELKLLNPSGPYVFMLNGNRTRAEYFRKALYKACGTVGIPKRSPHKLRKTYASILLDNDVAGKFITETMGHTDINTTNGSYARRRKSKDQRINVVSSIPEFAVIAKP